MGIATLLAPGPPERYTSGHMKRSAAEHNERRVLVATCFAHCMTHLYMLAFPALVTPLRQQFGLDLADTVSLSFMGYLLYGLCALPAGLITDRWSARAMLTVGLGLSGGGAVAAGLSRSPAMLAVAIAVIGAGASIYHPTGMALISRCFGARRGRALGLNGVFGNVGLASAPFVAGLLAATKGWRSAYLVLGAAGLVGAVGIAATRIDESVDGDGEAPAQRAGAGDGTLLVRLFVILCVAMTLSGLAYRASSLVMPSYLEQRTSLLGSLAHTVVGALGGSGVQTAAATTLTSLVYLVGIGGQLIGGRLADKRDLRVIYLLFHAATLPGLIVMTMAHEELLVFAAMSYVLFGLGLQPIENSLVARLSPSRWRAAAYGTKFILTFGIGATAVWLVGAVDRHAGLAAVFVLVLALELGLVLTAAVLWLVSRRALPKVQNR